MSTVLKVVKSSIRSFTLKRLICHQCQGFHVIHDSRLQEEYDAMTASEREVHERHIKAIKNRLGEECECGEGVYLLENEPFSEFINGYTVVQCSCGEVVECTQFTNTCSCGKDYNFAGSELADRSQWGYETGESWGDCY